ncbi:MAG: alanine racemase [Paracoccaceae bacterium]
MQATLTIDLDVIAGNWRRLDAMSGSRVQTSAVVKADAYGLGMARVAPALFQAGARIFFVAQAEEGVALRAILGEGAEIFNLSGYLPGDDAALERFSVAPVLNSAMQVQSFARKHKGQPCAVQFDTGMNRQGLEAAEAIRVTPDIIGLKPAMLLSHLACGDDPKHGLNDAQRQVFMAMTAAMPNIKRSIAATDGIMLGTPFHFDVTRPGIGLYGGLSLENSNPIVSLELPVLQIRDVRPGETVGYGGDWRAARPSKIATVLGGYADGILRASKNLTLYSNNTPCPVIGRKSMDMLGVDVTDIEDVPVTLSLLNRLQTVDDLAARAGTINYEILTGLGARYKRVYKGGK